MPLLIAGLLSLRFFARPGAAHIRWHQAGGPDEESNGLALCVLHHKTFDLGAFTVNGESVLLVADQANGSAGFQETLIRFHGRPVQPPQRPDWTPAPGHLDWHSRQVFKGLKREHILQAAAELDAGIDHPFGQPTA